MTCKTRPDSSKIQLLPKDDQCAEARSTAAIMQCQQNCVVGNSAATATGRREQSVANLRPRRSLLNLADSIGGRHVPDMHRAVDSALSNVGTAHAVRHIIHKAMVVSQRVAHSRAHCRITIRHRIFGDAGQNASPAFVFAKWLPNLHHSRALETTTQAPCGHIDNYNYRTRRRGNESWCLVYIDRWGVVPNDAVVCPDGLRIP
jgi:hypothetical protein